MRVVVAGLGVQGHKRIRVAGDDVVATVDPIAHDADYKSIEDVRLVSTGGGAAGIVGNGRLPTRSHW